MSKKKLEVVELNKKEEKIVLEEKQSPLAIFWRKHRLLIFLTTLILSLTILGISIFIALRNFYQSEHPTIKEVSIDTTLDNNNANITSSNGPITEETAKNKFLNNATFKPKGEVLVTKTIESDVFVIKLFSDGTAIKIMKKRNVITRINPLENGSYGIDNKGVINSKAQTLDVTIKDIKEFPWGTVTYYSDGTAEITDSKIDMFVRDVNDINENYISDNKVSYLKESKNIGTTKVNYYYDGTIEVVQNNQSYLVRNESDIQINNNSVNFPNNNQATIYNTKKLSDGLEIDYYTDGGAIIKDGTRTLSVRKSNSIIIKDNKIYEIVDNIYVEVSQTKNNGNITYYTNGGAVVNYNGETQYVKDNSNIKYQNDNISKIDEETEKLTQKTNIDNEEIQVFEETTVVKTEDYIAIVPKDSVLLDKGGKIKEITYEELSDDTSGFTITNNTNSKLNYRIVIEKSEKTNLDVQYLRFQLTANEVYVSPRRLDSNIWTNDRLANGLKIQGTNYILLDSTLEPHAKADIKLMLWTDYDTIPNSMQNKYFYGTIRVYAWTEK